MRTAPPCTCLQGRADWYRSHYSGRLRKKMLFAVIGVLPKFIGPCTPAVGVSTHNPLGVTFAAGVYASFLVSQEPINSYYARQVFRTIKIIPTANFQSDCGRFRCCGNF